MFPPRLVARATRGLFAEVVYNFVDLEAGRDKYRKIIASLFGTPMHRGIWHFMPKSSYAFTIHILGKLGCLDRLYITIKAICQGMKYKGKDPSNTIFYVLIPPWYNITLTDPLYFCIISFL